MTNKPNGVLYVGITSDLAKRVYQHKHKLFDGFTEKYNVTSLVYLEHTHFIKDAISREKQLKNWHRQWKIELIEKINPGWKDLSKDLGIE